MSKSVTKGRRHSLPAHANRGIMRFFFVSMCPFRAFVTDLDTIGSFLSREDWPSNPVRDVVWAEGSLGREHSTLMGAVHASGDRPIKYVTSTFEKRCSPRVWGQDGALRRRGCLIKVQSTRPGTGLIIVAGVAANSSAVHASGDRTVVP